MAFGSFNLPTSLPSMAPQSVSKIGASFPFSAGYDPASGPPLRPDFQSILGANGGLKAPYSATATTLSTDMSPWLGLQNQAISGQAAHLTDQTNRNASLGLGTGMSTLASSGGLDSGARERLMSTNNAQRMAGISDVGQQEMASRVNAGLQAEQMKRQAEQFNADTLNRNSAFNATNAIAGLGGQNAFNLGMYGQDMGAYGAAMTADAMKAAANKEDPGLLGMGGLLGTGVGGNRGVLGTGIWGHRLIDPSHW